MHHLGAVDGIERAESSMVGAPMELTDAANDPEVLTEYNELVPLHS